jgi:hypothetical protein
LLINIVTAGSLPGVVSAQEFERLTVVGECDLHFGNFMVVDGQRAFITTMEGLDIVDLSDPRRPVLISSLALDDDVFELARAGQYLYLQAGELQVVDIGRPEEAELVAAFGGGRRYAGLAVRGNLLHTVLYEHGLEVLDISDPLHPVLFGNYAGRTDGGYFQVILNEAAAYLSHLTGGLEILDLSDPAAPALLEAVPGTEATDDPSLPPEMRNRLCESLLADDLLIVGTRTALRFYDVTDPLSPRPLSTLGGFDDWHSQIHKLTAAGDLLFLCHGDDGIVVVDIADPRSPRIVGGMREPVHDMHWDGEYLYTALLKLKVFTITGSEAEVNSGG